jgi:PAS domain S-box-containing protein
MRLLIVEDSQDDVLLMLRALRRAGYEVTHEVVSTSAAMQSALERQEWDVITCDYSMPRFSAPAALAMAKQLRPEVPFIIVSGEIDLNVAILLLQEGAQDYIQKRELARLAPAIERELREVEVRRERRQAEIALRESEIRYRDMFDAAPLAIFRSSLEGKTIDINTEFLRMFGYSSREEFFTLVKNAREVYYHPEHRDEIRQKLMEQGAPTHYDNIYRHKDGSPFTGHLSIRAVRDGQGNVQYFEGFIEDITARKLIEEEHSFHSTLIENAADAIIALATDNSIRSWNPAAEAIYGWRADEVIGHDVHDFIHEEYMGITEDETDHQLSKTGVWRGELLQTRRDGSKIPVQASVSMVKDSQGNPMGFVAINRVITDLKQAEEKIRQLKTEIGKMEGNKENGTRNV